MVHGSFFCVSDAIDSEKSPGATSIDIQVGAKSKTTPAAVARNILTGASFFYSPNLVWFIMACFVYWLVPYRLDDNSSLQDVMRERLIVNHVMALVYIGFWHVSLYWLGFARRPFVANRKYSVAKLLHNLFYTWLGIVQWSLTEVAFIYCYRTNRLNYIAYVFESPTTMIMTALWSILVPVFRDVHFYFAHRLIHVNALYKYIHSVHHRNNDIEPFSGLCMHPVEHFYYFTCHAPCLVLTLSPFIVFWIGMHAVISPACSHSGYEDHFGADLYHYLHHRYSDCNYAAGIPFDRWMGTYRDRLKASDSPPTDPKANLVGWYPEHPSYQLLCFVFVGSALAMRDKLSSSTVALIISTAPCCIAALLCANQKTALLAPFDKEPMMSQVIHIAAGILLGVLPATYLLSLILSPK